MFKPNCKYGSTCYRKNPDHLNKYSHASDSNPVKREKGVKRSLPCNNDNTKKDKKKKSTNCKFFLNGHCRHGNNCKYKHDLSELPICACGGGQSCLIDRRRMGDWVFEDDILKKVNLPIRKSCLEYLGDERNAAIAKAFGKQ